MRTELDLPRTPAHEVPSPGPSLPCPGCGKTYTMLGTDREPGIYVRTLNDLFRAIEETSNDMEYEVSMSYLEVSPALLLPKVHGTGCCSPGDLPGPGQSQREVSPPGYSHTASTALLTGPTHSTSYYQAVMGMGASGLCSISWMAVWEGQ